MVPRGVIPGDQPTCPLVLPGEISPHWQDRSTQNFRETFMVLRRSLLMTLLIPWPEEMLPISDVKREGFKELVQHPEPKYIMTMRAVVTKKHMKKHFEKTNDELKVKLATADELKLALRGSSTTSSVFTGRCCPVINWLPESKTCPQCRPFMHPHSLLVLSVPSRRSLQLWPACDFCHASGEKETDHL